LPSASASALPARRGLRPWHAHTLLAREPGDPMFAYGMRVSEAATESPRT